MMNILISVNKSYLDKAITMLYSLRQNTKEDISVFLMNHSISDNDILFTKEYLKQKCKIDLVEIDVKCTLLDDFPIVSSCFSIEMYYRILAQFLLPESLERILWLDADIIINKDITSFYHQPFDGKYYVVCEDRCNGQEWLGELKRRVGLEKDGMYFNSGVMLMNLTLLRSTSMDRILKECDSIKDKVTFPDQDILNYLYSQKVKVVPWKKYNYQVSSDCVIPDEYGKEIVIIHYTGKEKPWNYWNINNASKYYWKVRFKQGKKKETITAYIHKIWIIFAQSIHDMKAILW